MKNSPENPLLGEGWSEARVGLLINNPHQVVGYGPKTPLKSPLVQGGTLLSSNVAPQRGMKNSLWKQKTGTSK